MLKTSSPKDLRYWKIRKHQETLKTSYSYILVSNLRTKKKNVNNTKKKIFLSPQVKRNAVISNKKWYKRIDS